MLNCCRFQYAFSFSVFELNKKKKNFLFFCKKNNVLIVFFFCILFCFGCLLFVEISLNFGILHLLLVVGFRFCFDFVVVQPNARVSRANCDTDHFLVTFYSVCIFCDTFIRNASAQLNFDCVTCNVPIIFIYSFRCTPGWNVPECFVSILVVIWIDKYWTSFVDCLHLIWCQHYS